MVRALPLLLLAGAGVLLPVLRSRASSLSVETSSFLPANIFTTGNPFAVADTVSDWQPIARATPYLFWLMEVESKHGIPHNLLARLIEQESHWDPKAFNGASGASGIAQIVPRWHPNVNPWEPFGAIDYAGGYLRQLFNQFGQWDLALAGYNYGPGNVKNWLDQGGVFAQLPRETQNYITEITGDVPA